jgi:hypothetical protein
MRNIIAVLLVLSLSNSARAEETAFDDLLKQIEELSNKAQTLLGDWVPAISPKLEELSPAIEDLLNRIEDLSVYHSPEVLENGDIIVRRKKPHVPKSELEPKALPNLPKNKGLIEL